MRNGFSFKGIHTNDFGLTVSTKSRPTRPKTKSQTYETQIMDGVYDFTDTNIYGREFFETRVIKADLQLSAGNLAELQSKLMKISPWLIGKGELIFDDLKYVIYDARVLDAVEYKPEHGKTAVLSVTFEAEPFPRLVFDTIDGPILDFDIELDSNIPIGIDEYFTFTGAGDKTVQNTGDRPARPCIEVSGKTTLKSGGKSITVPRACVIDCGRCTVTDSAGESIMPEVTGSFFELAPGENIINVSAAVTMTVRYTPRYAYGTDLKNFDKELGLNG